MLRAAALLCGALHAAAGALTPADFEVADLPGLNATPGFKHYAGYMPIGDASGTAIFFWFVESQRDPVTDPMVLWMNGGPGSSSVQYGFWTEHGPWRLEDDGAGGARPVPYAHSWNQKANVLYIEAPAGVGFSYSNDSSHYRDITDAQSSKDNFLFLQAWFGVFADFKKNDFYITAESYGGHYGPTLAEELIDNPNDINMKGLWIGNPGINSDWYYNVNSFAWLNFMYGHALIPAVAYDAASKACGWGEMFSNCSRDFTHPSAACKQATKAASKYIPSPLDPYSVLAPTCQQRGAKQEGERFVAEYTPALTRRRDELGLDIEYNPCMSQLTGPYLNKPEVLKAIHADTHYTRKWPNHPSGWSYDQGTEGEKKDIALIFPKFFEKRPEWKIVVVSGTADSAVPFQGTERWMECLARPVKKGGDFRAWKMHGDVAGMIKDWDGMSLVTVKGCGHTIPSYCPEQGYAILDNWLTGNW